MNAPPLYELTKSFCVAFYDNNQSVFNQLLSADCRMQDKYGKSARGVNGVVSCINKLILLKSNLGMLFPHGQGGTEMFVDVFDSNHTQSCCLLTVSTPDKLKKLSLCFGLEWDSNIIIGIVFRCNVDPKTYVRDLYDQEASVDRVRTPTSWDMRVAITGAVLSSADLDDSASRDQDEQFIFLHSKTNPAGTGGEGDESASLTGPRARVDCGRPLSEMVERGDCRLPARGAPLVSCRKGERQPKAACVSISSSLSVILVPEVKYKPNDGLFYSHIDFRRFTADADDAITELIKLSKSRYMDKEAAKLVLYQNPAVPLMTQFNTELGCESTGELSESDSQSLPPPPEGSPSSPSHKHAMQRENSATRALSFDDDVDRESFSRNHGFSADGDEDDRVGRRAGDEASLFDKLLDIITSALDSDEHHRSDSGKKKSNHINYYLKSQTAATDGHSSLLPLGYSLGRLLTVPAELDQQKHWVTLEVSVIGCNNLKSVLKRLFTRPVDSFVKIKVDDQEQFTEIQKDDKNPLYDLSSTYSFRLRPEQAGPNNFITFTVLDSGLVDDSILGYARVSFAALKAQKDNSDPTSIILPLAKNLEDISDFGKGFYNSNNYYLTRSSASRDSRFSSRDSFAQKNKMVKSTKETPTISIAVSKIDVLTHGMLEALRIADEQENSSGTRDGGETDLWTM